ncbi:MAG: putative addiction module component [Acidobacteriota bacterium]|jgi:putative addiction module component (TIGR02574 family)|nr:putative addiction module component [Acidobacteriota bacterium]
MDDAKKVLSVALVLGEHERAEIAARLLESLDDDDREGVDEAWAQELERRCAALDSGEAVTSDWNEFRARIERDVFGR